MIMMKPTGFDHKKSLEELSGEKKGFSFFNIWTRNDILAITITIYIGHESIFVVCFTDLYLTRINKRWANYVV